MFPVIPITDQIFLPTYITIISLIYTLSLFWLLKRSKQYGFSARVALDSAFAVMIGGFVGARLFHVFYEAFDYYQQDWMRVFYIWHGGFVFYGGAIGALIAVYFYTRISRIHFMDLADMYAIVFSVGYGFGRIACFLNGCCYGSRCDLPWSVEFPSEHIIGHRHPVQIYVFLWEIGTSLALFWIEKQRFSNTRLRWAKPSGQLFLFWVFFHALGRLMMEYFRDDYRGPSPYGMSISSWISVSLLLLSSHYLFHHRNTKR